MKNRIKELTIRNILDYIPIIYITIEYCRVIIFILSMGIENYYFSEFELTNYNLYVHLIAHLLSLALVLGLIIIGGFKIGDWIKKVYQESPIPFYLNKKIFK